MEIIFEIRGNCCDLALHPVSESIAEMMRIKGAQVYKEKYMRWWRKGNTATCGMRIDGDMDVIVTVDGTRVDFDPSVLIEHPIEIRRRMYLESKASHLCVLGYDQEPCRCVWKWSGVKEYDPARFEFLVQRWDRVMGIPDYYVIDNVFYDHGFADRHEWCDSKGFSLLEPIVIDLGQVRREVELEKAREQVPA